MDRPPWRWSFPLSLLFATILLAVQAAGCLPSSEGSGEGSGPMEVAEPQDGLQGELADHISYVRDNSSRLAYMIHVEVNRVRMEYGLHPLEWDQQLADIALAHSRDMSERDYFDHLSPEGEDFADRYKKNGYTRRTEIGNQVYLGGENLALNNVVESYVYEQDTGEVVQYNFSDLEKITRTTVEGWMGSEGHRKNILSPFTREGIGVYVRDDGKVYVTENFS